MKSNKKQGSIFKMQSVSGEASPANCSSLKKIIIGIPLLFSKFLRKAFKKLFLLFIFHLEPSP
ncbi:hypothetical protein A3B85_00815 [Candidatus Nomurabacteria bacterium RIFCSPHIGHO2_02_FULL_37_13]|uniref:Uncharacterized protein n=1 Tax=Candidatus Nomurabacteria bacterium RIFCSPHIGHO2_02_FULL_37_13 TaxID=1801750 RepID=A0A1F6W554_9BACT|nr:MAG: hypothetical protein A2640_03185 [Candidatus Nomurabacteria bacterium RIFCSPHIGHO2_01_FULL_36_23]OGI77021.1 MAG: hypothetical protein A3B85_00815 [Candidatus Nomurabacteria bacterium RIFCSPHIGHO2_02_FULL_37_13]OGI88619.1 MAG: hypothetical protein A2906_03285 [Candidatus Nomurabacteria bacterium RIFCSPLOWO2_01_FULL_37_25]